MTVGPVTADVLRAHVSSVAVDGASPPVVPDGTLDLFYEALGSPDPEVRDELALGTLAGWIVENRALPASALLTLHRRARGDEGLLHRVGERGEDSVFRRSFSALLLAILHAADNADAFLDDDEWRAGAAAVAEYGGRELDVRAEVPGKGWAHAIAHTSDVADELVRNPRCDAPTASLLLDALLRIVGRADGPFDGEEEDRVAVALTAMVDRRLVTVGEVADRVRRAAAESDAARINGKAIARSLYFRVPEPRDDLASLQADLSHA